MRTTKLLETEGVDGMIAVLLVADLFRVDPERVAESVVDYRRSKLESRI